MRDSKWMCFPGGLYGKEFSCNAGAPSLIPGLGRCPGEEASFSKFSKPGFNSTWTMNFQMFKLDLEKAEKPETKLPTSSGSWKKAREFQKNIYFCFIDCTKAFDCVDYKKWENSSRDRNTRSPYLPPEKSVCSSRSNSYNWTWNNRLVPNWERSTSRLYIVTLLI